MLKLIAAMIVLFSLGCAHQQGQCFRVTLMKSVESKGVYLPHWHLGRGDVLIRGEDKIDIAFHDGHRFAFLTKDIEIVSEECR